MGRWESGHLLRLFGLPSRLQLRPTGAGAGAAAPTVPAAPNTDTAAGASAASAAATDSDAVAAAAAAAVVCRDLHTSLLRSGVQKCVRNRLTESAIRLTMQAHGQAMRSKKRNERIRKLCDRMVVIASEDCSDSVLGLAPAIFLGMTSTTRDPRAGDARSLAGVAAELAAADHDRDPTVLLAQKQKQKASAAYAAPRLNDLAAEFFAADGDAAQVALALLVSARAAVLGNGKSRFERWETNGGAMAKVLVDRVRAGGADPEWWARLQKQQKAALFVVEAVVGTAALDDDRRWVRPMDMVHYAADHHTKDVFDALKVELHRQLVRAGGAELLSDGKLTTILKHLSHRNVRVQ